MNISSTDCGKEKQNASILGYINNPQVRKINVNESSIEQMKHPYLKPYIAKAIVNFRNQHGKFQSIQDLKAIKLLTPDIIQKLEPYLAF